MEKLRRENNSLKTELAMEFRQFRKPVDSSSADRIAQVRSNIRKGRARKLYPTLFHSVAVTQLGTVGRERHTHM